MFFISDVLMSYFISVSVLMHVVLELYLFTLFFIYAQYSL